MGARERERKRQKEYKAQTETSRWRVAVNVTFASRFHSVGALLCILCNAGSYSTSQGELAMQSIDTSLIKFSVQHDTRDCTGACRNTNILSKS